MATHSSILAWRIPWTEEPVRLWSMGSHRVRHDRSDLACTHACSISFTRPTGEAPGADSENHCCEGIPHCAFILVAVMQEAKSCMGKSRLANGGHAPWLPGSDEGRATSYYTASGISSKEKRALDAVYPSHRASLGAQTVKNPPAMQETWVRSLGWDDPLEEGMATHSSILSWRIPRTEGPGRLQSMGWQRVGHDLATKHSPASIPLGWRFTVGTKLLPIRWSVSKPVSLSFPHPKRNFVNEVCK